jgi:N-acetylglutamate synthase-like GNAT family acetyltransferase
MLNYKAVAFEALGTLFNEYVASLKGVYDEYLESHILKSTFYFIEYHDEHIGYFAIYDDNLLTQFYIRDTSLHLAQGCFKSILEKFSVKRAYVATCDELFLSLSMDFQKRVELQAYFFSMTDRGVSLPHYPKSMLRLASLSDVEKIKSLSDNFFSDLYQHVSDRIIYILEDDEIYGFGIMTNNKVNTSCRSIGVFTVEEHRQKGVGRSIVLHLNDLCKTLDLRAVPGCWYHNYNAKRTIESCGFASTTRLLKIVF